MLDFYLIEDDRPKPNNPEEVDLKYVAGLDYRTFENLIKKEVIDSRFDYYADFRWSTQLIKQMVEKMNGKSDADIKVLNGIISQALKSKCGLIAYCD